MLLLLHLLCLLAFSSIVCRSELCTKENCLLPSCQCPISNANPTTFNDTELPQFVLFTFVGNLNKNNLDPLRAIFNSSHRNPNKCPISSTFFVQDIHTDYCLVQRLFENQHEIAMTTVSNKCPLTNCYNEYQWHRWTNQNWQQEIKQQRINLVRNAQIHHSHLKGFRVPHLQIDQNQHLDYLHQYHLHYDSSMLFNSSNFIWPFTLNYPFNQTDCVNCQQWTNSYEALWQFPLHEWTYPNTTNSCRTLSDSSCLPSDQSPSADLYFNLLMHNFERHSSFSLGYRSPFVIQLDLSWLSQNRDQRLRALVRFIRYISTSPNHRYVYFISIEKTLEWMKYPRPLHDLRHFWAFRCDDQSYQYDNDCSYSRFNEDQQKLLSNTTDVKSNNTINGSDDTQPMDRQAEKLFSSSIALHALWISFLLILGVLFYDKYFTSK